MKTLWLFCLVAVSALFPGHVRGEVFTDGTGRIVEIEVPPTRIVSLAPSVTETLFALGLEKEIVGVSLFSTYPEEAKRKEKVGSFINISLEKVVALDPDLVIGTSKANRQELHDYLGRLGYSVYLTSTETVEDIFRMISDIGAVTGKREQAARLVASLQKRMTVVKKKTAGRKVPRVFFQIGIDPIVSVGRNSFHDILITLAGGYNIAATTSRQYPRYSIEEIIAERPDIIILSSMKRGEDFERVKTQWKRWKNVPAVMNERIHVIDSDLTDHPSPRIIDGLERMAEIIHPEVFQGDVKNAQ